MRTSILRIARALILVIAFAGLSRAHAASSQKLTDVATKLGKSKFMLGVSSSPGDTWIGDTATQGAKWDARYQYLAGGVNTGNGWTTWNTPAGQFLTYYLDASAQMNCIPVLTYYQMQQSTPGAGMAEDQSIATNCANNTTMYAYYDEFKLAMQKCGAFAKPVIFHVEPDMWGYMFNGADPAANYLVKVKSSGHPDATLNDTAGDFGKTLVAMRDKYAPNVLLAWHASKWGTPDTAKLAAFIQACGNWDIIFCDPSDRDSGFKIYYNYMASGAWWADADFTSFRDWNADLYTRTGLPLIAWQIPMGNTYIKSCDNTPGHFMDNRPEYFLENYPTNTHISDWAAKGFIGLLFGGGAGNCTDVRNTKNDGITNPTAISGNHGETAQYSDDDGGYMRLRGGNYYTTGALALQIGAPPGSPAAPSALTAAGGSGVVDLAWTDNATDETGFKLERSPDGSSWTQIATPAANATTYHDTGLAAATSYSYRICATNAAGDSAFSNTITATTFSAGEGGGGGGNGGIDTDGDGVSDSAELAAGTNPNDANSFPTTLMTVSKFSGKLNFKLTGKDACSISGTLPAFPALFDPTGLTFTINAGGAQTSFLIDDKAKSKNDHGSLTLKLKPSKRNKSTKKIEFQGGPLAFSAKLIAGNWTTAWSDEGANPAADAKKQPLTMTVDVHFDGTVYRASIAATYSAKAASAGKLSFTAPKK
jgi:hypothetical protein